MSVGHKASGGGATIKNSPINITVNIHIHKDKTGKIKGAFANAFTGRFRKPIDPTPILERVLQGGNDRAVFDGQHDAKPIISDSRIKPPAR